LIFLLRFWTEALAKIDGNKGRESQHYRPDKNKRRTQQAVSGSASHDHDSGVAKGRLPTILPREQFVKPEIPG
jgi:hypothetical protein